MLVEKNETIVLLSDIAYKTVNVRGVTKDKLLSYKKYARESYDDVIDRKSVV